MNLLVEQENLISFEVLGKPQALKRHRTFRKGNFTGTYDPSKQDKESFLAIAHQYAPAIPLDCPLRISIDFCFPRPKSHYRGGKHANELKPNAPMFHVGRPDTDNLVKFIADSLNGVFWRDDSLLCQVYAQKLYSERPRTVIKVGQVKEIEIKSETETLFSE